jgi:SAM-dependent methyltransferase
MRLDLGGGYAPAPGHINIDLIPEADIVWDLNQGLPESIKGNYNITIEGIRCNQLIEHLDTIIPLMNDCYDALKPGGLLEISTPKGGTDPFWQDPTHKKGYVKESFLYFCKDSPFSNEQKEYGITARFVLEWELLEWGWNLQVKLRKPL